MSDEWHVRKVSSSSVLIAVAAAFIVVMSLLGLVDGGDARLGATWTLRGTLVPPAQASPKQSGAAHADRSSR